MEQMEEIGDTLVFPRPGWLRASNDRFQFNSHSNSAFLFLDPISCCHFEGNERGAKPWEKLRKFQLQHPYSHSHLVSNIRSQWVGIGNKWVEDERYLRWSIEPRQCGIKFKTQSDRSAIPMDLIGMQIDKGPIIEHSEEGTERICIDEGTER